ncbi:MAG: cytochrome c [Labilithrix sp.]|nr:cytochrome c [Labilithrix sp.]MCW5814118.1 cytochrome c [Labilithrix sp.]
MVLAQVRGKGRGLPRSRLFFGFSLLATACLAACDRPPSVELKEWTPADHDGEKKTGGPAAKQGEKGDAGGTPALVEIAWRNQCATCHGPAGKGDGPQGPMFKAADLSTPAVQDKLKDEDIAAAITNGKGRMPKFDLPPDVVQGLVTRVRSFRAN